MKNLERFWLNDGGSWESVGERKAVCANLLQVKIGASPAANLLSIECPGTWNMENSSAANGWQTALMATLHCFPSIFNLMVHRGGQMAARWPRSICIGFVLFRRKRG